MKLYIQSGDLKDIVSGPNVEACIAKAMNRASGGLQLGLYFEVSEQGFDSISGEWEVRDTLQKIGMLNE